MLVQGLEGKFFNQQLKQEFPIKVIHTPLTRTVRITFIVILTMHDVAIAVYSKYFSDAPNRTGFMGHLCGACAGLLVGVFALQNRRVR